MSTIFLICFEFFKTGLFAIGGGLATIPFLYEMSDVYGWFSHHEILNFIAVAESTPGPVGINMATYAGYLTNGLPGAILTTFSLVLPSVVVILIVAKVLERFRQNKFVIVGFHILRPASTALIAAAGFNVLLIVLFDVEKLTFDMFSKIGSIFTHVNWIAIIIFVCLFIAMKIFDKVHPLVFILISAAVGIALGL